MCAILQEGACVVQKSITTRYFYATAMLLITSIAVMGFIQIYLSSVFFKTQNDHDLLAAVDNTIRVLNDSYKKRDSLFARDEITREITLTAHALGNYIFVTDSYGRIVIASTDEDDAYAQEHYIGNVIPQKVMSGVYNDGRYLSSGRLGGLLPTTSYIAAKPIRANGVLVGYVVATAATEVLEEFLANMVSAFILSAGLMLVISSILSVLLSSRMTTPLCRLAESAQRFGAGDFSVRVPEDGDDELAALAVQFNQMAQSLERIDISRRSFMGNIAHELRTPMTSIQGFIDGILDGTIPPDLTHHYLSIASKESGRLTRLIQNMMDITKLEAGEYSMNLKEYDVWETLTGVVFAAEQRMKEKDLVLRGFAPVRTLVVADPDFVHQVAYNLIDNAIKFTPSGGQITLSVVPCKSKGMATVCISNTGQGLTPEQQQYVFERFYKTDESRGLHAAGSGLGLHICKVLIGLCGGQIWVTSRENEHTSFTFTLPLAGYQK